MIGLIFDPSGRWPVRSTSTNWVLVHLELPAVSCGVRFAAAGQSGGVPGIFPPERLAPWQPVQPAAR